MGRSYRKTVRSADGARLTFSKKGVSSSRTFKSGNSTTTVSNRAGGKSLITHTTRSIDGTSYKSTVSNNGRTARKTRSRKYRSSGSLGALEEFVGYVFMAGALIFIILSMLVSR